MLTADELWERAKTFSRTKAKEAALDPALLVEAAGLLLRVFSGPGKVRAGFSRDDVHAMRAVAACHGARYQTLPHSQNRLDVETIVALLALVESSNPEAVPPAMQSRVAEHKQRHPGPDLLAAAALTSHAKTLSAVFQTTGSRAALEATIAVRARVPDLIPPDHPRRAGYLANLSGALQARFQETGAAADLNQAAEIARRAVAVASPDDASYATILSTAGTAFAIRFERLGDRASLDEAISAFRQAAEVLQAKGRGGPVLSNLSGALRLRFDQSGALADLEEAVETGRIALSTTPHDNPQYVTCQFNLGGALGRRYTRTGVVEDLEEAIRLFRDSLHLLPPGHPARAEHLASLGQALGHRYERSGSMDDLTAAIEALEAAVTGIPQEHTEFPRIETVLAEVLGTRSARTGERTDLDRAVELAREAVDLTPQASPERAERLSTLGALLDQRSRQTLVIADAEAAVLVLQAAVATGTGSEQAEYVSRLGIAFLQRALMQPERSRRQADMEAAVDHLRRAVDCAPRGHPARAARVANLVGVLQDRYELAGVAADLDEAIRLIQQAVADTPEDHRDYVGMLSNLGSLLGLQSRRTRNDADLEAAEHAVSKALRARQRDDPARPLDEFNLALVLHDRFERSSDRIHGLGAVELFGRAARAGTLRAHQRVLAARLGAALAGALGDWDAALGEYEMAVELLAVAAWHGLQREDRVFGLGQAAGLASDAAAAALQAGQPEQAVVLLEQARGVLLGHALDMRTDRAVVREHDPALADQMDAVRAQLDQAGHLPSPAAQTDDTAEAWRSRVSVSEHSARQQELAREWDTLVARARTLPGLAGFLRPPAFDQLRHAADEGPVVIVNASRHRCDLLILSSGRLRVVPLPDIDVQAAADETVELQQALIEAFDSRDHLWRADSRLRQTLAWLWDRVVSPAVDELGLVPADREDAPLPRVWWCPTGIMCFLPLHATGHHPPFGERRPTARTLLDYAASSYTPTLRALIDARDRSRAHGTSGDSQMLMFALPEPPPGTGLNSLPQVQAEIQVLQALFPGMTSRIGPDATRSELLAQLPLHGVLHFTGHGGQDPLDPARAILCTYDQPVAVSDLARLEVTGAQLAFLSACQTAVGAIGLPDESIHISGALQLAGFPHVIATQWSILDSIAPQVAERLYELLAVPGSQHGQTIDTRRSGEKLNQVTRDLRDRYPPVLWAPFVHAGA